MHTSQWDRERFRDVLEQLQERTNMSQADLAELAGRNRTQINRWVRAENQPGYTALQRLVAATSAKYPDAAPLARELLEAAGYGSYQDVPELPDAAEAKAAVPTSLEPATQPQRRPTVQELQAELDKLMAQMSPEDRERLDRIIAEEEAALEAMRLERQLKWLKLMRGEPIYPEQDI